MILNIQELKKTVTKKILPFLATMVATSLLLITSDSLYYGPLSIHRLLILDFSLSDFKIAPWNFLAFNLQPKNLAVFGSDPWHTHLTTNLSLLFGPLAPVLLLSVLLNIARWKTRSGSQLLVPAFLVPLLALSLVGHQEPRYLSCPCPCPFPSHWPCPCPCHYA